MQRKARRRGYSMFCRNVVLHRTVAHQKLCVTRRITTSVSSQPATISGTRPENQMKMVTHNGLTQQIDTEVPSLMNQLVINPQLALITVASGVGIVAQQKTATHRAIHDMHDSVFLAVKDFRTSQASHHDIL